MKKQRILQICFLIVFASNIFAQIDNQRDIRVKTVEIDFPQRQANRDINGEKSIQLSRAKRKLPESLKPKIEFSAQEKVELKDWLNQKNTKLIKIWNNTCGDKIINSSDEKCVNQADFIIGSVYSFYKKQYMSFLGFIKFQDGNATFPLEFDSIQLISNLGDVSLENLDKKSKEFKTIKSISNKKNNNEEFFKDIEQGIKVDNLTFSNKVALVNGNTYLLRTIFNDYYQITGMAPRMDKVFAFRVLNQVDEFVTIAWKEID